MSPAKKRHIPLFCRTINLPHKYHFCKCRDQNFPLKSCIEEFSSYSFAFFASFACLDAGAAGAAEAAGAAAFFPGGWMSTRRIPHLNPTPRGAGVLAATLQSSAGECQFPPRRTLVV